MVIDLLASHSSVRDYEDETLSRETVERLVSAGQHAASSHFVQAYSVIHVTDPAKRQALAELSKNPKQFLNAGAALIFCMDFRRLEAAAALQDENIVYSNAEALVVGVTDTALFAQNVAVAAESEGYGICYIGGVRNAPEEISEVLGLPKGVAPLYGMTIGVPKFRNEVKPRLPVSAVLHENEYNSQKYEEQLPEYDRTMNDYYLNRGSNRKDATWSGDMAEFLKSPRRMHLKEFLGKQGFRFE
ncbi:NADPH-dependent oxidoreductase [Bhargavaea cecembensis]|uniref:NADPH-dependent oxidoreductase n=1 Tax=Bhargavaea cecembensis TaxID=394098 RepID=A0A161RGI3_9BACL|nr:oxygen-insensitive NADPH nitroreductase [Bhargavaea cecembensis]KZE37068.1 NADPH-dependent oxidoreductase [Bhargavaea cecembensis]